MTRSWKRVVMASMLMLAVGCRTPVAGLRAAGASDSGNTSDSGNSGGGDSSKSDSGNSSGGDSSKSGSGDSSGGDSSRSESSGTSEEGTSHSESSDTSDSTGSDSGDSSESGTGSEEGDSSRSESNSSGSSDNSSGSSDDSSGSSDSSDNGTSKSSQVDPGEEASSESGSSNGKDNRLLSTAVVALTVLGLGVVIWQVYEHSERGKPYHHPSPQEVGYAAQVYLRARTHQLREDLALGAGPTVEDLAQAARIRRENLDVFGRLLRAHRKELLAMAEVKTLTPERARAWLERVGELARTEPRLEEDRQAFLLRQEGAATPAEATR